MSSVIGQVRWTNGVFIPPDEAPSEEAFVRPRRIASPLLGLYRWTDPAAALAVLCGGWIAEHFTRTDSLLGVLALPVSLADVLLLLGFLWTWPFLCDAVGLYDPQLVPGSWMEAKRVAGVAALGTLLPGFTAFLPLGDSVHPRDLLVFAPASAAAMLGARTLLRLRARLLPAARARRVVIAGSGPRAVDLWREIRDRPELGAEVVGFIDEDEGPPRPDFVRLGVLEDCEKVLMRVAADEVMITLPVGTHYAAVQALIAACERTGTDARYFADLFHFSTTPPLVERSGNVALRTFPSDYRRLVKRAIDVVVASGALVLAAPLMAAIALAIRLESPGPAIFAQERCGLHRRRFRVWKFRTMISDAEARQGALEARNEATGPLFKIRDDPRVTRVGRLLRRSSLDELPQLLNVLLGEMSLVGPRPLPVRDVARFPEPWLLRRFGAPPGLTGLWQVQGRSEVGFDDLIAMDLHYIERWSLALDLRILLATVPAVLRGHGAM